jgi:hypothetical protein
MVHPVLSSVLGKWIFLDAILVDTVSKMEKDAEGCLCKYNVRRMGVNMEDGKVFC